MHFIRSMIALSATAVAIDARQVDAQVNAAPPNRTRATVAREAFNEFGRATVLCARLDASQPVYCTTLGLMNRHGTALAVAAATSLRDDLAVSPSIPEGGPKLQAWQEMLGPGRVVGCARLEGRLVSVAAGRTVATATAAARASCTTRTNTPFVEAFEPSAAAHGDIAAMVSAYQETKAGCQSGKLSGPGTPTKAYDGASSEKRNDSWKVTIGKIWAEILGMLPPGHESPPANDGNGVRGMCDVDGTCASCEAAARTAAVVAALSRWGETDCVTTARPGPNAPKGCFQRGQTRRLSREQAAALTAQWCDQVDARYDRERAGCILDDAKTLNSERRICASPAAMCSEDANELPFALPPGIPLPLGRVGFRPR